MCLPFSHKQDNDTRREPGRFFLVYGILVISILDEHLDVSRVALINGLGPELCFRESEADEGVDVCGQRNDAVDVPPRLAV